MSLSFSIFVEIESANFSRDFEIIRHLFWQFEDQLHAGSRVLEDLKKGMKKSFEDSQDELLLKIPDSVTRFRR